MTGPDSGVQRDSHTYPDTTPAGIRSVSQHVRSANSGTALRRSACPLTAIACWPYTHSPVAGYGQFFMTANIRTVPTTWLGSSVHETGFWVADSIRSTSTWNSV